MPSLPRKRRVRACPSCAREKLTCAMRQVTATCRTGQHMNFGNKSRAATARPKVCEERPRHWRGLPNRNWSPGATRATRVLYRSPSPGHSLVLHGYKVDRSCTGMGTGQSHLRNWDLRYTCSHRVRTYAALRRTTHGLVSELCMCARQAISRRRCAAHMRVEPPQIQTVPVSRTLPQLAHATHLRP